MPHIFISLRICGIILPMKTTNSPLRGTFTSRGRNVFITAFLIFAVTLIPSLIMNRGMWLYYGDYNVQQIPFYMHVHSLIRSGNIPYDFSTDLGGSVIGCYSFYLLGSPFFWLSVPFKTEMLPYVMPWLTALKYGVMALTAYIYMKRHLKTDNGAFIGSLLFAFSGFQGAVLVYNHFHDAIAFFPLYLITFENMIEKKNGKRNVVPFALMTTLSIVINYYFFVGEAVFLVIYYFVKYKPSFKDIVTAFLSGLSGLLISGAYLLPAISYTMYNKRLSDVLNGYNLIAYEDPIMPWGILKNVVMLPDVSGLNSMMNPAMGRVSGVGAYIPLFSIAGVIAFFLYNKEKRFEKRIIIVSLVCALVPALNAMFSAFNSEYYARWFYMPILFMAMMTASVLEERDETLPYIRKGSYTVALITFGIIFMSVIPTKTEEGTWTVLGAVKNYEQLVSESIFSLVMIIALFVYLRHFAKKSDNVTVFVASLACFLTTFTMFLTGTALVSGERRTDYVAQAVTAESPVDDDGTFFRLETDQDFFNYPLFWDDAHSVTSFISTIPNSTLDVYTGLDIPRKVSSNPYVSRIGLRAILSSRYFLTNTMHSIEHIGRIEDMSDLKGYSLVNQKNGFKIYENENYIPMGISYDGYITESEYAAYDYSTNTKDRLLADVLIIKDEDEEKVSTWIPHRELEESKTISLLSFGRLCEKKNETACEDFTYSSHGFEAKGTYDGNALVMFSVPYEKGFTAYVDDNLTHIFVSDFGFMAVPVKEGTHSIRFEYRTTNLAEGMVVSIAGVMLLLVLCVVDALKKSVRRH